MILFSANVLFAFSYLACVFITYDSERALTATKPIYKVTFWVLVISQSLSLMILISTLWIIADLQLKN